MSKAPNIRVVAVSAVLLAAVGCASTPKSVPDIAGARALISQAEQSDAQQYASADLEAARSELRQADQNVHDNKPVLATRLAQEASTDAEVAMARTRAIKSEQALADVNAGTTTLRSESLRQDAVQSTTSPPPVIVVTPVQR
jgi:Domain of unknown function (DUF4398)